jgi:hypothetical protein
VSETQLVKSIRSALSANGIWNIRVQSGVLTTLYGARKHFVHCAEAGTPDIFCPAANVWLECKTPTGRVNAAQIAWHSRAEREGVPVVVVRSVAEALDAVRARRKSA